MFELRRMAALLLALGLLGPPLPARGQDTLQEQALIQHLDTLIPLVLQARAEKDRAAAARDSALRQAPGLVLDTFRVGLLRVVAFPDQTATARDVIEEVWAEWGDAVQRSDALESVIFFFDWASRDRPAALNPPLVKDITASRYVPRAFIKAKARTAIWTVINTHELPRTRVGRWAGTVRPPQDAERVYRELATSPSAASRRCVRGETSACLLALGLRLPQDPLAAWYTPEERMRLALADLRPSSRNWDWFERTYPDRAALLKRCEAEGPRGDLTACDRVLGGAEARSPLVEGRSFLAWLAVEAGGPGAFDRLVSDSAVAPEDALVAASGLPLEALTERWLAWVQEHKSLVYTDLGAVRWTAFLWFLLAGLLALRSTRWRFG